MEAIVLVVVLKSSFFWPLNRIEIFSLVLLHKAVVLLEVLNLPFICLVFIKFRICLRFYGMSANSRSDV